MYTRDLFNNEKGLKYREVLYMEGGESEGYKIDKVQEKPCLQIFYMYIWNKFNYDDKRKE